MRAEAAGGVWGGGFKALLWQAKTLSPDATLNT